MSPSRSDESAAAPPLWSALLGDLDVSERGLSEEALALRRDYIDAAPIFDRAIDALRPYTDKQRLTLSTSVAYGRLPVHADAERLKQIAVVVLSYAASVADTGGRIWITAAAEHENAVFAARSTCSDPGSARQRDADDSFAAAERLAQRLISLHSGTVTIAGSDIRSFVVSLPLSRKPTEMVERARPGPDHASSGPQARILIVDDNADWAESMAQLLERQGKIVSIAHDGSSALSAVEVFLPEVILLDIGLPGLNGYEVARQIRSIEKFRDLTIIGISGFDTGDESGRGGFDFDVHLTKPIDIEELLPLLSNDPPLP